MLVTFQCKQDFKVIIELQSFSYVTNIDVAFEYFLVIGYMIYWHTKRYDQLVGKREELEKIQRGEIRRVFKLM